MEINRMIDHTLLKPNATRAQIEKLCDEALEYHFASVCVNTCWVPLCAEKLAGSDVNTCCVVGFPLGAMLPAAIVEETRMAVEGRVPTRSTWSSTLDGSRTATMTPFVTRLLASSRLPTASA